MALESRMIPLGTPLPDATLPDLGGQLVSLRGVAGGRPLLVAFACNHCPYVKHLESEIGVVAAEAAAAGIAVVAICSNDVVSHPDDDVAGLRDQVARAGWDFPYLVDADQRVAHEFSAACTPDFFLFDADGRLAYRGAFDGSTPGNGVPVTGELMRAALADVAAGRPVAEPHRPSMGCGIKWTPGNEPA